MTQQMSFEDLELYVTAQSYFYICLNAINPGDHLLVRNTSNKTFDVYRLHPGSWDPKSNSWVEHKPEFIAALFPNEVNEIAGWDLVPELKEA